eukprot:TRINITY_DN16640_c0_g1_i1.p1 TRINITY_DN16640_c0_g1~~TRINITY_DN16640_c0_g1_i1.p1  ORF type:complete len:522 (-),score=98.52 TRINITY_DN16640_c0_g1_i1:34-1599(-)
MQQSSLVTRMATSNVASTFSSISASLQLLGVRRVPTTFSSIRVPLSHSGIPSRSFYAAATRPSIAETTTLNGQLKTQANSNAVTTTIAWRFLASKPTSLITKPIGESLFTSTESPSVHLQRKGSTDSTAPVSSNLKTSNSILLRPAQFDASNNLAMYGLQFASVSSARFFLRSFMRTARKEAIDVLRGRRNMSTSSAPQQSGSERPHETTAQAPTPHSQAHAYVPPGHAPPNPQTPITPPPPPPSSRWIFSRRTFFGIVGGVVVLLGIGATVYMLFLDQILELLGSHGAKVAQTTLGDERVKQQAQELSSAVVNDLLVQDQLVQHAVQFVKQIANQEETLRAVSGLLNSLLADPATKRILLNAIKDVGYQFIKEEETLKMVTHLAFDLLHQPATKDALVSLLVQVMNDPVQKKVATDFVISILQREEVFAIVNDVAKGIVASVLSDEHVKTIAVEFVRQVVSDQAVQKDTGDALYSAVKYAVFPWGWKGSGSKTTQESTTMPSSLSSPSLTTPEPNIDITK